MTGVTAQGLGARVRRDNLRSTWVPTGEAMRKLEAETGLYIRFIIGYRCVLGLSGAY